MILFIMILFVAGTMEVINPLSGTRVVVPTCYLLENTTQIKLNTMNNDTKKEEWRDVKGFEGYYQISNLGRVKSLYRIVPCGENRTITICEKILKTRLFRHGYPYVSLRKNGIQKNICVHKLLAEAFLVKESHNLIVNHKDGVKTNNDLSNLEYVTYTENIRHAFRLGLNKGSYGMLGKSGKLNKQSKMIAQYTKEMELVKVHHGACEAARNMGTSQSAISNAALGNTKSCKGFIWKYI